MIDIQIKKTKAPKQRHADQDLKFWAIFTDHMFLMDYARGPWVALSADRALSRHLARAGCDGVATYRAVGV